MVCCLLWTLVICSSPEWFLGRRVFIYRLGCSRLIDPMTTSGTSVTGSEDRPGFTSINPRCIWYSKVNPFYERLPSEFIDHSCNTFGCSFPVIATNEACSSSLDLFYPVNVCTQIRVTDSGRILYGMTNKCTVGGLKNFFDTSEETNGPGWFCSDRFNVSLPLSVITYGDSEVLGAIYCLENMTMQLACCFTLVSLVGT